MTRIMKIHGPHSFFLEKNNHAIPKILQIKVQTLNFSIILLTFDYHIPQHPFFPTCCLKSTKHSRHLSILKMLKKTLGMKVSIYTLLFFFSFLVISCEKDNKYGPDEAHPVQKEKISGFVQKGPFINGTSITISELTPDLVQTGKTFSAQLSDNKGSFEFRQVELSSQFVEMKADGFYFKGRRG